jgi:hypothetical protein
MIVEYEQECKSESLHFASTLINERKIWVLITQKDQEYPEGEIDELKLILLFIQMNMGVR